MKLFINISSIIIMLLSISSLTSAQGTQRPSQRSFATVIARIKEKKKGRDRQSGELKREEPKVEGKIDPEKQFANPGVVILPSRQRLLVPVSKKGN